MESGLYEDLVRDGLLISHEEISFGSENSKEHYKTLKPTHIPFISYPYEWSFSQLKDAALITLKIQKKAISAGMWLKDASAYNIQFLNGNPVLIDTLSFEKYEEGKPWVGYKQFCQHFLAPLALMSYKEIRLSQLLKIYIDGIPLDLASRLLPAKSYLRFSILAHIHLHAKSQKRYSEKKIDQKNRPFTKNALYGLINGLNSAINKLRWSPAGTEWGDYYSDTNYSDESFEIKKRIVSEFLDMKQPKQVWDFGGNTGLFSRIASEKGIYTMSFDIDPAAVEKNYLTMKKTQAKNLLPLLLDLTNPAPGIGWDNKERDSLKSRGPAETILALALIHHLAIVNNLPLEMIAEYFADLCNNLIIEFVPKEDSQVIRLLSSREDIFPDYNFESFRQSFEHFFDLERTIKLEGSERTLCLMTKKNLPA